MRIGVYVFGIAAVAYGITDLVWGEFDRSDQPLQAWGDHVPGATIFAYIAALWLVVAGAALLWRGSRRFAAASGRPLRHLCAVSFAASIPRRFSTDIVLGREIILFVAAVVVWKSLSGRDSLPFLWAEFLHFPSSPSKLLSWSLHTGHDIMTMDKRRSP
jgi:hypothetical protein